MFNITNEYFCAFSITILRETIFSCASVADLNPYKELQIKEINELYGDV